MLNYWWITRPKRKLNSIPEVLACCASVSLDCEWQGNIYSHLAFEKALEDSGLKRRGERRDQRGGGGRTYFAWLSSLGLIFTHEATGQTKLTLAGEAIMNGDTPVNIIRNQILKYQFPSPFSLSPATSKTRVNERFKIRPFRFLLRLLTDARLEYYLTQDEIAKIIVTEAERETDKCYNYIVDRIIQYRSYGDEILQNDFFEKYAPSSGKVNTEHPFSHLEDLANTIVNWLEYTQYISREVTDNGCRVIKILDDKMDDVNNILKNTSNFIDRPNEQEYFQRKYGLDPNHQKDNRNLSETHTITAKIINEQKIKQAFITESLKSPIASITPELIRLIAENSGIEYLIVEEILNKCYPRGAIGAFMTEYFEMAFKGREEAVDFEKATVQLFQNVFGFSAKHVGSIGLTPDVLLLSDDDGYQGIIDNKAYSSYSINNDHHNRMVHNYIENIAHYSNNSYPLAFFSYIAGGFGKNINTQLNKITTETGISGSAVSVSNIIKMVEKNQCNPYSHKTIRDIFSCGHQVSVLEL